MARVTRRWRLIALAGCLLAVQSPVRAAAAPVTAAGASLLAPLPVELEYRARKLIFTSVTRARLEIVPSASVADSLRTPPEGSPIALPPDGVGVLTVESEMPFGRWERMRLLLDPRNGGALQAERAAHGRRTYRSVSRYTKEGIYSWRWSPADRAQEKLAPEAWTVRREEFSPYPAELPAGAVVTDAYAVIPLAAAAHLEQPSGSLRLVVPSYHGFLALDFLPERLAQERFEVEEDRASGRRVLSGPQLVRQVRVSTRAVPSTGRETAHELGVLGFEGGLTLSIDAATGLPFALNGHAPYLGTVVAKLVRVRYATDPTGTR